MRTLHLVPVIHSPQEMGEAAEKLNQARHTLMGNAENDRHGKVVAAFWHKIHQWAKGLKGEQVCIYQDSLVDEGELGQKVVDDLAAKGSPNFLLVQMLLSQGARLRKTESLALLQKEHALTMDFFRKTTPFAKLAYAIYARIKRAHLLRQRDRFIAQQINATLKPEEVGVLFIGALHEMTPYLEVDIKVIPFTPLKTVRRYLKTVRRPGNEAELQALIRELTG